MSDVTPAVMRKAKKKQQQNVRDAAFELHTELLTLARDYDAIPEVLDTLDVIKFVQTLEDLFNEETQE